MHNQLKNSLCMLLFAVLLLLLIWCRFVIKDCTLCIHAVGLRCAVMWYFIRGYLRIAFCCWTTSSQLPECFFLLFWKKNSWNIWGNCNIAGLKKAWNCQYLKSCTGRVYLFFCWSLHLSYFHVCYWPSNQCRRSNIYKVTAEDQLSTGQTKRVVTESVGCNSLFLNCFEMVFLAHHILSLNYRSAVLWNDVVELVLAIFYKLSFKKKNLLHVSYTVLIDQDI